MRSVMFAAAMFACVVVGGCTSTSGGAPELESNLTYDGLAKVKNSRAKAAWMRPDFSLAGYNKIMLHRRRHRIPACETGVARRRVDNLAIPTYRRTETAPSFSR